MDEDKMQIIADAAAKKAMEEFCDLRHDKIINIITKKTNAILIAIVVAVVVQVLLKFVAK